MQSMYETQSLISNFNDQSLLVQAVFKGDPDEVRSLIYKKEGVNAVDSERRTALHAAAYLGDAEVIELLILSGAHVNAKDNRWLTPLHRACASRSGEAVKMLLKHHADVNARDKLWQSPLHVAAANDAHTCAELLIPKLSNLNLSDRAGRQALHHAALSGHLNIILLLIRNNANVQAYDRQERRAIHWAAYMGHTEIVKTLVSHGAEINCKDKRNCDTPMHAAAASGQISVVKMLLDLGFDVNTPNARRDTPLHLACFNGQDVIVHELLESGAKVSLANDKGCTPLHHAAASTHGALCLELLVNSNANVNAQNAQGKSPLHMTAVHGRFTRSQTLLQHGAKADIADHEGNTALHVASRFGHELLVTTLLEANADPMKRGTNGVLPIHLAAGQGHINCCRKLLSHGNLTTKEASDLVIMVDNDDRNCLHYAACSGSLECLEFFLSHVDPQDAYKRDKCGRIALHYALGNAKYECSKRLIIAMVDYNPSSNDRSCPNFNINDADNDGRTLLHHTVPVDWSGGCVELLLERNADCFLADSNGYTPLHYAARCGHDVVVKMLVEKGDDIVKNTHSSTETISPLHLSSYYGHTEVVTYLSDVLIDLDICDSNGRNPLDMAAFQGHSEVLHTLLLQGASIMHQNKLNKQTAMHLAASNGHTKCMQILLEDAAVDSGSYEPDNVGKLINAKDINGVTALMFSATNGHANSVDFLLARNARTNCVDSSGCTALHRAAAVGHEEVVMSLLQHIHQSLSDEEDQTIAEDPNQRKGPATNAVNQPDINGRTPIHFAAIRGQTGMLDTLLHVASSVNLTDKFNYTPLHYACYEGHEGCVDSILGHESFTAMMGSSFTPLHCAILTDNEICAERLLEAFEDEIVSLKDSKGRTPLHIAALKDHVHCIRFLYSRNADVNVADNCTQTPLMVAAANGQDNATEILLSINSNVSLTDVNKNNALHLACNGSHNECAYVIIEKGFSDAENSLIDAQNNEGKTPLHIAARNGLVKVTELLLERKALTYVVDNQGLNAALACAPNNDVADCLDLIINFMMKYESKRLSMATTLSSSVRESSESYRTTVRDSSESYRTSVEYYHVPTTTVALSTESQKINHTDKEENTTEINGDDSPDFDTFY